MKPPPFDYVRPTTVREAVDLLSSTEREVKVLAGGQSLMPVLNMRMAHPEVLLDISRLPELSTIEYDDGALRVGAAVTQSRVATDPAVRAGWPVLAAAIENIGHPQLRNRGTVCGSLAHNDSAAELPAVAVLLDARLSVTNSTGTRTLSASDFFLGTFTTALEPEDLLLGVEFPRPLGRGWSFHEFAQRRGDFASAGVGVVMSRDGDRVADVAVVLFGVGGSPVRPTEAENDLRGGELTAGNAAAVATTAAAAIEPGDDIHATGVFRREIVAELLRIALLEAWERAA